MFVLTDDLSSDLVRYMPHVRRMQQHGVSFTNYFVVDSLCCPSRAAILTGRYPHNNGVYTNVGVDGGYRAFMAHRNAGRTFAVALHRAGYRTALTGKYLNRYAPAFGVPRGWSEWDAAGWAYRGYNYRLNENGVIRSYGDAPRDYATNVLSRKASGFATRALRAHRPFALEIAPWVPHEPAIPAPRDVGSFAGLRAPRGPAWNTLPTHAPRWLAGFRKLSAAEQRSIDRLYRRRVQSVQAVDRMIGHLQDLVRTNGAARRTYFVFSSDNGLHLGQYRMLPGKHTAFDTDIRVPLIVTGPGVPGGRRVALPTASIDLASTFERIAGTGPAYSPDGRDMLALWHGRPAPANWPRAVLIEHHGTGARVGDPDAQVDRAGNPPSYEAIRTAHSLYVEYVDGEREFYDLRTDPHELHNIIGTVPRSVLGPIRRALHLLAGCHGAGACSAAANGLPRAA